MSQILYRVDQVPHPHLLPEGEGILSLWERTKVRGIER